MQQMSFMQVETTEYHPRVCDLPVRERPVQRLREVGPGALSIAEVIAAVLQTPDALCQAQRLLVRFDSLRSLLNANEAELVQVEGIGPITAARIKAALELGRRMCLEIPEERLMIRSPTDIATLLMADMGHLEQEHFRVMLLNTRNGLLHQYDAYVGSLNSSHIRVADVFREAVRWSAAGMIVAHNHPSGDPTPSPEDVQVTRNLVQAGSLMDIELLDHVIVGHQRFVSLRERGLGFS